LAKPAQDPKAQANLRELLDQFEEALEALRIQYDKYFVGVDRTPPADDHRRVQRQLRELQAIHTNSTVHRFRLQGLRARVITYEHYWRRVLLQIENGTFRRDQHRALRKAADAKVEPTPAPEGVVGASPQATDVPAAPVAREPSGPRPSVAEPVLPPGMGARQARELFKQLLAAKQAAGEKVDGMSYGAFVRRLASEAPKLQAKHGSDALRFEVATVDGKVRLRAKPV